MIEQEGGGQSPRQERYSDKPHEELVQIFRAGIEKEVKRFKGHYSPELIVRLQFQNQYGSHERFEFFRSLAMAWDVLAYEHYAIGSNAEADAGIDLQYWCGETGKNAVTLNPVQVKIIDALADALSIPHERG